jgi:hypothetical protein
MYRALYAAENGASGDGEDRLLVDRLRLCAKLILAGVAIVFAGELLLYSGRPYINLVQAINFAACAAALAVLRNPERRSFNLAVGFTAYVITIVSTATVGILASDATTPVIIMVGTSGRGSGIDPLAPGLAGRQRRADCRDRDVDGRDGDAVATSVLAAERRRNSADPGCNRRHFSCAGAPARGRCSRRARMAHARGELARGKPPARARDQ